MSDSKQNPKTGRVRFPDPETMTKDQRAVHDQIISGPRGKVQGPFKVITHNPALADRWQRLGQVLRFETSLPKHLNELAILVTARRWNSAVEWTLHEIEAKKAGLEAGYIDAIRDGKAPDFGDDDSAREIYAFARQLVQEGNVDDAIYHAVLARWDEVGVVELAALVGYYSMVATTLNVHRIPLPDTIPNTLDNQEENLATLPPA